MKLADGNIGTFSTFLQASLRPSFSSALTCLVSLKSFFRVSDPSKDPFQSVWFIWRPFSECPIGLKTFFSVSSIWRPFSECPINLKTFFRVSHQSEDLFQVVPSVWRPFSSCPVSMKTLFRVSSQSEDHFSECPISLKTFYRLSGQSEDLFQSSVCSLLYSDYNATIFTTYLGT